MKLVFCRQIFKNYSNIKFLENLSGCTIRTDRQADRQPKGRMDMTKVIVLIYNFENETKKEYRPNKH